MMRHLSISIILLLLYSFSYSQCEKDDYFPLKHGISISEAKQELKSNSNISVIGLHKNWDKPFYLYVYGDSVYKYHITYRYSTHPCLNGNNAKLYLKFVDDKLYFININCEFDKENIEDCIKNYNSIVDYFKSEYEYYENPVPLNSNTKEQYKETVFHDVSSYERYKTKRPFVTVSYRLDEYSGKKFYFLTVSYVNLSNTKLTIEGF